MWRNNFFPQISSGYKGYIIKISYGQTNRLKIPKYPYITFLKYGQKTNKGVYPYIDYMHDENVLRTGFGISRDNPPEVSDEVIEKINQSPRDKFNTNKIDLLIEKLDRNLEKFEILFNNQNRNETQMKIKNIILYGSPGVGKTHNTNKLIKLIEEGGSQSEIFEAIRKNEEYDGGDISDIKERVKFVTFHQSFGYEDFIEGFRPNEDGKIELVDGVFKTISKQAKENLLKSGEYKTILFSDAIRELLQEKIESEETVKIDLKKENSFYGVYDYNERTIFFEKQNGNRSHSLSIRTLEQMYNEEVNNVIHGGLAPYYNPLLERLLKIKNESRIEQVERKNYYLVIDEINRGNISKIFGELITLIEEDKRDKIEVTLPYSKLPFKVPSNLYIIGTMNSTDKSIALIDIALRRRFTFLKMTPNENLVPEIARNIFTELNKYISESHLGEDYQIGHSYFMGIVSEEDLKFILDYKVRPLLEEYFYGDKEGLDKALQIVR